MKPALGCLGSRSGLCVWGGLAACSGLAIRLGGRSKSKRPIANRPQISNLPHKHNRQEWPRRDVLARSA